MKGLKERILTWDMSIWSFGVSISAAVDGAEHLSYLLNNWLMHVPKTQGRTLWRWYEI